MRPLRAPCLHRGRDADVQRLLPKPAWCRVARGAARAVPWRPRRSSGRGGRGAGGLPGARREALRPPDQGGRLPARALPLQVRAPPGRHRAPSRCARGHALAPVWCAVVLVLLGMVCLLHNAQGSHGRRRPRHARGAQGCAALLRSPSRAPGRSRGPSPHRSRGPSPHRSRHGACQGARERAERGLTGRRRTARREWTRLGPQSGEGEAEHLERLRPLFSFSRRASPPADSGDWMARARARPPPLPKRTTVCAFHVPWRMVPSPAASPHSAAPASPASGARCHSPHPPRPAASPCTARAARQEVHGQHKPLCTPLKKCCACAARPAGRAGGRGVRL